MSRVGFRSVRRGTEALVNRDVQGILAVRLDEAELLALKHHHTSSKTIRLSYSQIPLQPDRVHHVVTATVFAVCDNLMAVANTRLGTIVITNMLNRSMLLSIPITAVPNALAFCHIPRSSSTSLHSYYLCCATANGFHRYHVVMQSTDVCQLAGRRHLHQGYAIASLAYSSRGDLALVFMDGDLGIYPPCTNPDLPFSDDSFDSIDAGLVTSLSFSACANFIHLAFWDGTVCVYRRFKKTWTLDATLCLNDEEILTAESQPVLADWRAPQDGRCLALLVGNKHGLFVFLRIQPASFRTKNLSSWLQLQIPYNTERIIGLAYYSVERVAVFERSHLAIISCEGPCWKLMNAIDKEYVSRLLPQHVFALTIFANALGRVVMFFSQERKELRYAWLARDSVINECFSIDFLDPLSLGPDSIQLSSVMLLIRSTDNVVYARLATRECEWIAIVPTQLILDVALIDQYLLIAEYDRPHNAVVINLWQAGVALQRLDSVRVDNVAKATTFADTCKVIIERTRLAFVVWIKSASATDDEPNTSDQLIFGHFDLERQAWALVKKDYDWGGKLHEILNGAVVFEHEHLWCILNGGEGGTVQFLRKKENWKEVVLKE